MRRLFATLCLFVLATGISSLHAQVQGTAIGPKAGFYISAGRLAGGAIAEFPLTRDIDIEPGIEAVVGIPNTTRIVLDANGRYSFTIPGETIRPFLLGGLGLQFDTVVLPSAAGTSASSTQSDFRLNIGGGTVFNSRDLIQYWVGLKLYLLSGSDAIIQGGVLFYL